MSSYWVKIALLTAATLFCSQGWTKEITLYRYKDKDGHPVITSTLPSDVADKGGYDIISPRGNVLETVPPAKTPEEIAKDAQNLEKAKEADKQAEVARKQAAIQAKKDEILLKSFTSEQDIIRSRDEKIASIEVLEGITKENITRLQKQLDDAKVLAQKHQSSGQQIPESLQKMIEESQRQISDNVNFLNRKKAEKDEIHAKYQELVNRFHELQQHPQPNSSQPAQPQTAPTTSPPNP
ncbi:MAG: hypothetical protein BGO43_06540 [Gammaproteobacteria bacterium 39-13]|nr:hypothetical protein [Gammaproteobacteria bacterium]OJV90501.1 MAG: hypothetical protein BGO43_06540 [Gammaproteobacteria bacterium 39-13]